MGHCNTIGISMPYKHSMLIRTVPTQYEIGQLLYNRYKEEASVIHTDFKLVGAVSVSIFSESFGISQTTVVSFMYMLG